MKYNLSDIMRDAWSNYRFFKKHNDAKSFGECLKLAWNVAKALVAHYAEIAAKGIVRMHYSDYKNNYSDCKTVDGSYDKRTKTIEVMTKVSRNGFTRERFSPIRPCPRCHSWCYGDCTAH